MATELQTFSTATNHHHHGTNDVDTEGSDREALIQTLHSPDRGKEAYKFLFAAFIVEGFLWGFPLSYGLFQKFYQGHPDFEDQHDNVALVGTLATSIFFLGAPLATPLAKRFQRWQREIIVVGWLVCVISLVAASFAKSVWTLVMTQGVLYGLGFTALYFPVLRMLNEWFIARRGLAYGVMFAGGGLSGAGYPFLLELLLSNYGFRTTLRAMAVMLFVVVLPILPFLKGRLPVSQQGAMRGLDISFFKQPLFYLFAFSNLVQALGYYIPGLFLPTYVSSLGLSGTTSALVLAAFNLATTFGQVSMGLVSDRVSNALLLVFVSSFVSSVASFFLWGFATSLPMLLAYALIYGWFAGGFVILWPKFGSILSEDPGPVYSMMAFGKGIGNILIGPLSNPLMSGPVGPGYGLNRYEPLILYLGSMMLVSSLSILGWPIRLRSNV